MIVAMDEWDKQVMCERLSLLRTPQFKGLKRIVEGEAVCMAGFDDWMPNSVQIHVWLKGARYLTRLFIVECWRYAFVVCNRGIVFGVTPCNNGPAIELNKRLGFERIATVKDGFALGVDLAIQEMRREKCRWLR